MGFRITAHFKSVASGLDTKDVEHATQATLHGLRQNGGSSVNLKGHSPSHGWMVGGVGPEKAFKGGPESVSKEHVSNYIHENAHHLKDPSNHVGSWHDTEGGKVTLDVSKHFSDRDAAHAYARKNNEDAVYNLHEDKTEPTDWQGEKRPERVRSF